MKRKDGDIASRDDIIGLHHQSGRPLDYNHLEGILAKRMKCDVDRSVSHHLEARLNKSIPKLLARMRAEKGKADDE